MKVENHFFLGLAILWYIIILSRVLTHPETITLRFFIEYGFIPIIAFGIAYMLDKIISKNVHKSNTKINPIKSAQKQKRLKT